MKLSAAEMRGIRPREIKYEKDAMLDRIWHPFFLFFTIININQKNIDKNN